MNNFEDQSLKASRMLSKKLTNFCEPLKTHFNINFFYYHAVTDDGNYFLLANQLPYLEYYFSEKLYFHNIYMRDSSNFNAGLQYHRHLQDNNFQSLLDKNKNKHNISTNFLIMHKMENGFESYGIGSDCFSHDQDALIMRELPLLNLFIRQFREEFSNIINRKNDFQVNMKSKLGNIFHQSVNEKFPLHINHQLFLKRICNELSYLSKRELGVFKLLIQGKSASAISNIFSLSARTVEHYIENIKNKLNCNFKNELVSKYSFLNTYFN